MNKNIDTAVSGKFIITDKHGNVVSESKNMITDYGMSRISGYVNNNCRALADNFKYMHIGFSGVPTTPATYKMDRPHTSGGYTTSVNVAETKTEYTRSPAGNLKIVYTTAWDYTFSLSLAIKEVGMSHVPKEQGGNVIDTGETLDIRRTDFLDDVNYSLFSRAVVPTVAVNPTDEFTIKYVFEMIVSCGGDIIQNISFDNSTIGGLFPFPDNKTNIRQLPLFPADSTGPLGTFSGRFQGQEPDTTPTCPILEVPHRGQWVLDFFEETGAVSPYNTMFSTTTADVIKPGTTNPFDNPLESERIIRQGTTPPRTESYRARQYPFKIVKTRPDGAGGNSWRTVLRFLFKTDEWPPSTSGYVYGFSLWRGLTTNQQINYFDRSQAGLFTSLKEVYNPGPGKFIGMDYSFTFTRIDDSLGSGSTTI